MAFFLTGAYQEVLGMKHNLFTHPTEAVIRFDKNGNYEADGIIEAQNLMDILDDLDYDTSIID
ncbi:arginine decarboxylase, partial [sediment metagenome]